MRLGKAYEIWELRLKVFGEVVSYREMVQKKYLVFTVEEQQLADKALLLINRPYMHSVKVTKDDVTVDFEKLGQALALDPQDLATITEYRVLVMTKMRQLPEAVLKTMQNIKIAFGSL